MTWLGEGFVHWENFFHFSLASLKDGFWRRVFGRAFAIS
jgi:hypothetical protein